MRFLILVTSILAIGAIGDCSQQARGDDSDPNDSIFEFYEFPTYPQLTHLCQQRVYGTRHEITWDAFATSAKPSALVTYYRQKLGDAGFTRDGKGGFWRRPADAPRPQRVLDIKAIGTKNPSSDCKNTAPANSRSIIIVSRMH